MDTAFGSCFHEIAQVWNGTDKEPLKEIVRKFNLDATYKRDIVPTVQNYFKFHDYYKIFESKPEEPIELKNNSYWLYGIIDKLIIGSKGYLIVDYKTAKKVVRERHIFQMKMYGLIISKVYNIHPDNIKYLIYYPRLDYKDEFSIDSIEIEEVEKYIVDSINEIESCTEWPASKSFLCNWCQYNGRKEYCP
jgi:CRISPR/Cas system-associated exonuclease Cas4 (RecB family)